MNTYRTSNLGRLTIWLVLLAGAWLGLSARAATYTNSLADGTLVTMTVNTTQTVLTLTGLPRDKFYRLDSTTDLVSWVTLDLKFKLNNSGTYSYTDNRALPKCFYRIREL